MLKTQSEFSSYKRPKNTICVLVQLLSNRIRSRVLRAKFRSRQQNNDRLVTAVRYNRTLDFAIVSTNYLCTRHMCITLYKYTYTIIIIICKYRTIIVQQRAVRDTQFKGQILKLVFGIIDVRPVQQLSPERTRHAHHTYFHTRYFSRIQPVE